jgi:hypothetical protein
VSAHLALRCPARLAGFDALAALVVWGVLATFPACCAAAASVPSAGAIAAPLVIDDFESAAAWSAHPADGVELTLREDDGLHGHALRADFRFVKGGGYAVLRREVSIDLPANYEFRLHVRGQSLPNNLEFKLVDSTGDNVWWMNRREFHFPANWDSVRMRRRQIEFAWGPAGGGELRHVAAIEIAITAGQGGTGTAWFDDLELVAKAPPGAPMAPIARASSQIAGHDAGLAVDSSSVTAWHSAAGDAQPWLSLDLGEEREFGGLSIEWAKGSKLGDYAIDASSDEKSWRPIRIVHGARRSRDDLATPESEARFVRVRSLGPVGRAGCGIAKLTVQSLEWSATDAAFFRDIARRAPRGRYPRSLLGEPSYWTIAGVEGAQEAALLGEDGALEPGRGSFSVEPFLVVDGRLVTWNDVRREVSLDAEALPIPTVRWRGAQVDLEVTAFAVGEASAPKLYARYRLVNHSGRSRQVGFALAVRPFQVNPPVQFLGSPGGPTPINSLRLEGRDVIVNGERCVSSLTRNSKFCAEPFDEQDIVEDLARGTLPATAAVSDPQRHASGALLYALALAPRGSAEVDIRVTRGAAAAATGGAPAELAQALKQCQAHWRARLGDLGIEVPDRQLMRTLRAQVADILMNRQGAAIQPGPRSYARSWIRDGALASAALLRLGRADVVRDYLDWFAPFQFTDGRIPCCVDGRGADPVPELDSNGEFIFLVTDALRLTGNRAQAERLWPAVTRAVAFLDSMRSLRRGPEWRGAGREPFFGLLPPSISHEGYSARAMHSYWDDFFALRGYRDAAWLAGELGHERERASFAASRDTFAHDLAASVRATLMARGIDFVPGCADLGDFDATSTTIGISPLEIEDVLPPAALDRTLEKYWTFFSDRASGRAAWEAFTPYELRIVGAMARYGWRDRANALLEYFMAYRRPAGWAAWAEVVWHDEREARFIGDLPHTWVGAEFARSVLDMLAFERSRDSTIVIGAGVPRRWLEGNGVRVRHLATRDGPLSYTMMARGDSVFVRIEAGAAAPGGIVIRAPGPAAGFAHARVNGREVAPGPRGELVVRALPAEVTLWP